MRLEQNALLMLLVAVIVFFAILPASRATFLSPANLSVLLGNQSTVALLSLAVILPLVSGYFDFSVGAIAATSTVVSAGLMSRNASSAVAGHPRVPGDRGGDRQHQRAAW